MNRTAGRTVAFIGVMTALMFAVLAVETWVFVLFINMPPAILTIPLAIALSVFGDWKKMFIGGTIFGLCSFVLSFILGLSVFYNPLISVLPRVLMGVVAYFVAFGMVKLLRKSKRKDGKDNKFLQEVLPYSVAGAAGVLFNTVSVLFMMWVFAGENAFLTTALSTILSINFVLEFVCAIILVPVLVRVMKKAGESFIGGGRKEEDDIGD